MQRTDAASFSILAGDVEALLSRAESAEGVASRRYGLEVLEQALAWADPGSVDEPQRVRAAALGVASDVIAGTHRSAPLHAVRIPLVDTATGKALVRTFFASFDAAPEATPELEPSTDRALREAFDLARKLTGDPRVRPLRWVAAQPRALERIAVSGESLAAGALVSAFALLSGRAVRTGTVITGTLLGSALGAVGHIPVKLEAARRAGARSVLVPRAVRAPKIRGLTVHRVGSVTELLEAALEESREELDADTVVRRAREQVALGWRGFRWPEALELLERATLVVPEGDLDTRVELLARLGAAERHAGSLSRSEALLLQALALAEGDEGLSAVTDVTRSLAHQQHAMTLLRKAELSQARRAATRAPRTAERARSRREQVKALGVVGLVARGRGHEAAAIAAFERALALDLLQSPHRVARSRAYLLESLARAGRVAAARAQFDAALLEVKARGSRSDEAWVRVAFGAGLTASRRFADARAVLDVAVVHDAIARDPLPGLRARRHLGESLTASRDVHEQERGLQLLSGAMGGHGRELEPGLRQHAGVCLLVAALAAPGAPNAVLDAVSSFGEGAIATDVQRLRAMRAGPQRARALARLVDRLDRLP